MTDKTLTELNPVPLALRAIDKMYVVQNDMSYKTTMQEIADFIAGPPPYAAPAFASFALSGQATQVEVGTVINGFPRNFAFTVTNSGNITPNTLSITDVTASQTLISGANFTSPKSLGTSPTNDVTFSGIATHTWRSTGQNSLGANFSRNFSVESLYRKFYGTSSNTALSESQIEALLNNALSDTTAGTYNFAAGGYKYIAIPTSSPAINTVKDANTNFNMPMVTSTDDAQYSNVTNGIYWKPVSVTNGLGATTTYRLYRTKNQLGATASLAVT